MAVYKFLEADRTALAAQLATLWDTATAAGPCTLKFYDGAQPAGPATAVTTQVLLGTLTCSDPIGSAAAGVLTFGAVTQDNAADATGTATWARLLDADGVARADFDVTNTAGTGAVKINTVNIVAGGPIAMNSLTITMGGA
jgi:hypothetical protein